jgi:hypothetical protein
MPKRDAAFDGFGRPFRFRIVPCRVLVHFTVDDDVAIAGLAFPRADAVLSTRLKILGLQRRGGK